MMDAQERRILYKATHALAEIPFARDDRGAGQAAYSRDMKEAMPIFQRIMEGLLFKDSYSDQTERITKLEAIAKRANKENR